jgi:Uma2 family endonuclease
MSTITTKRATLDDLYKVEGKAELVNGRIIRSMSGDRPTDVAAEIFISLRAHAKKTGVGIAKSDGIGYAVPELTSGRESFSPDASWYDGPRPQNPMRFIEGPPTLAVEVRSENDYGQAAEVEMAAKRLDYFEAGTRVVWDVDPIAELVHVYRADQPAQITSFHRGDTADAEPAVPGWRMKVDDIFA